MTDQTDSQSDSIQKRIAKINKIFEYLHLFASEILIPIFVILSAMTGVGGCVKVIPIIFSPFLPIYAVYCLIFIGSVSSFTAFWGSYKEAMSTIATWLISYLHKQILSIFCNLDNTQISLYYPQISIDFPVTYSFMFESLTEVEEID